ncbi:MAG TPA: alpha-galactosidase [Planctomycetes bacterium]|nr:alpha-galactosidase [Planctomycetota bacterium]
MRVYLLITTGLLLACAEGCGQVNQEVKSTKSNESITIDNGILSVSYNLKDGTFTASRGERLFIEKGTFQEAAGAKPETIRTVRIKDTLGVGEAIRVEFPSGFIYTLALYKRVPFVCVKLRMHNPTNDTLVINKITPVSAAVDVGKAAKELRILGCDGLTAADENRTSYMFLAMADPATRMGVVAGWLTHGRASGIVLSRAIESSVLIEGRSEYGKLLIEPGKTAEGETLAVGYFDDALAGLEAYADAIAKTYKIELPEIPSGYCTWYSKPYGGASDEKHIGELADFCAKNLRKFGFEVLQIDDKWQLSRRDYTSYNSKGPYPNGMKPTAEKITSAGLTAGIWFTPFGWDYKRPVFKDHQDWFVHKEDGQIYSVRWGGDCLDMTHPEARKFLDTVIRRITRQWGYKYIKIDGLWSGMAVKILYPNPDYRDDNLGDAVFHNPAKTNVEAYRDGLKLVREASGDDVYILGCNIAQNMRTLGGSIGLVDAMRVGSDIGARWGGILKGASMGTRLYFLHNRVWHNDPDCLMLRDPLTLDQARAWGSWVAISGQLNIASEWLPGLPADKLDVVKRSMPNHGLCGRPMDLFANTLPQVWHLTSGAGGQRKDIVGMFNWDDKNSNTVEIEPDKLDLPSEGNGTYVGFDYWANKFVPPFSGALKAELRPSCCKVIAIRPLLERPVLVGTSRHITQGIVDVIEEEWNGRANTLSGKSKVVGADPYEIRIFAPTRVWQALRVNISEADRRAGVTAGIQQDDQTIRVTIKSPDNRRVRWKVAFQKRPS